MKSIRETETRKLVLAKCFCLNFVSNKAVSTVKKYLERPQPYSVGMQCVLL